MVMIASGVLNGESSICQLDKGSQRCNEREIERSGMFVHSPTKLKNETALDPETSNKSRKLKLKELSA